MTPIADRIRPRRRVAFAPGRVNLIGDHTDYVGGLALPIAVQLGTTVDVTLGGAVVELRSDAEAEPATVPLGTVPLGARVGARPVAQGWGRYVAAVVDVCAVTTGATGTVRTTLPIGAGLSSSAALAVAVALALVGDEHDPIELARRCQRAEHVAVGVPSGLMDQLTSLAGVEGHALLMDFESDSFEPVPMPPGVVVWVVHSGEERALVDTPYAARRAEAEAAVDIVGSLRTARPGMFDEIADDTVRRRARHVATENDRVRAVADAFARGDVATAGALMSESHRSLRDDMDVSTPTLDALVEGLERIPGVHGARVTGAGFGGCVVALADAEVRVPHRHAWKVVPSAGARVVLEGEVE